MNHTSRNNLERSIWSDTACGDSVIAERGDLIEKVRDYMQIPAIGG